MAVVEVQVGVSRAFDALFAAVAAEEADLERCKPTVDVEAIVGVVAVVVGAEGLWDEAEEMAAAEAEAEAAVGLGVPPRPLDVDADPVDGDGDGDGKVLERLS